MARGGALDARRSATITQLVEFEPVGFRPQRVRLAHPFRGASESSFLRRNDLGHDRDGVKAQALVRPDPTALCRFRSYPPECFLDRLLRVVQHHAYEGYPSSAWGPYLERPDHGSVAERPPSPSGQVPRLPPSRFAGAGSSGSTAGAPIIRRWLTGSRRRNHCRSAQPTWANRSPPMVTMPVMTGRPHTQQFAIAGILGMWPFRPQEATGALTWEPRLRETTPPGETAISRAIPSHVTLGAASAHSLRSLHKPFLRGRLSIH